MKVFLIASLNGKQKYLSEYKLISTTCKEMGHVVIDDYIFKRSEKDSYTKRAVEKEYLKLQAQIMSSDVVIAEITESSTTIGAFILLALQFNKPVLVLTQKDYSGLVLGDPNRLLLNKKYTVDSIMSCLMEFFEFANKRNLNIRFNMMIDKEMEEFIETESKSRNLTKSNYIRTLVRDQMPQKE